MIKTIINDNPIELDRLCNKFMQEKNKNMAVRDSVYVLNGKVIHKAVLFYDGDFSEKDGIVDAELIQIQTPPKPKHIGALWIQKSGKISGIFHKEKIYIPDKIESILKNMDKIIELTMKKERVKVIKNQNKIKEKSPDFIIYNGEFDEIR